MPQEDGTLRAFRLAATFVQTWERTSEMLLILAVVLVVLWLLGFLAFHIAGALIHILLVIAVIALVFHFVQGRRAA